MMAFKVHFHNTNLASKTPKWATIMPKWATKMLKLATCCLIFVAKKVLFLKPEQFYWRFLANKTTLAFKLYEINPKQSNVNI